MENENTLIKKAKNGDVAAFEELVGQHQQLMYNLALKLLGNENDAADAAQDALIKVYRNLNAFNGKSKFSTWIYRIAYNTCLDQLRRRKKDSKVISLDRQFEEGGEAQTVPASHAPTPEEQYESKELSVVLHNAIAALSEEHRAAIILRDVNGYSYDEIAKIQGCSLGTVKSRINRARGQLKKFISKEQNGD